MDENKQHEKQETEPEGNFLQGAPFRCILSVLIHKMRQLIRYNLGKAIYLNYILNPII